MWGANSLYEGVGAEDGREGTVCTKEAEWRMGGNGAFVRREQSGLWVMTERRMGGIGAFVWCVLRKVSRLSENTL